MAAFSPLQRGVSSPGSKRQIRRPALILVFLIGLAGVAGTAKSVAYYTTAGRPHTSMEAAVSDVGAERGAMLRRRAPSVRLADVTDSWLQSLLDPSFWRKRGSATARPRRKPNPETAPIAVVRATRPMRSAARATDTRASVSTTVQHTAPCACVCATVISGLSALPRPSASLRAIAKSANEAVALPPCCTFTRTLARSPKTWST